VIDDTWLTYINAKYSFSFRYPPEWTLKEIAGSVNTMSGSGLLARAGLRLLSR
jgi:hypothetical protein